MDRALFVLLFLALQPLYGSSVFVTPTTTAESPSSTLKTTAPPVAKCIYGTWQAGKCRCMLRAAYGPDCSQLCVNGDIFDDECICWGGHSGPHCTSVSRGDNRLYLVVIFFLCIGLCLLMRRYIALSQEPIYREVVMASGVPDAPPRYDTGEEEFTRCPSYHSALAAEKPSAPVFVLRPNTGGQQVVTLHV